MAKIKMTNVTYRSTPYALTALVSGEVAVGFPGQQRGDPARQGRPAARPCRHHRQALARGARHSDDRRGRCAGVRSERMVRPCRCRRRRRPRSSRGCTAKSLKALNRPDVKERFAATELEPVGAGPEQFAAHIRSEIEKWGKVVKATGMKPQ